jgi:hypothetical protein
MDSRAMVGRLTFCLKWVAKLSHCTSIAKGIPQCTPASDHLLEPKHTYGVSVGTDRPTLTMADRR